MPEGAEITLETTPQNDLRSYHVSSRKDSARARLGSADTPSKTPCATCATRFKAGKLPDSLTDPKYFNVKTVQLSELG